MTTWTGFTRPTRNLAVVYKGPQHVEVEDVGYPRLVTPLGQEAPHGVIVKVLCTNICGSDQHMYRGKTSYPVGGVFGHEILGEVVEIGEHVQRVHLGDLIVTPFNISCGTCRNCNEQKTNLCLTVNDKMAGGAFGFADMGGWIGGQAEYVMCPFADFQALVLPEKSITMKHILELTMLSDILPTGFDAAMRAKVGVGAFVYIAGCGPVGIACAASCVLLGAAQVVVGDPQGHRLTALDKLGPAVKGLDLSQLHGDPAQTLPTALERLIGQKEVDCSIDCVGFEATGHGAEATKITSNAAINGCIATVKAGGCISCPGLYTPDPPTLPLAMGNAWSKAIDFAMGQCPAKRWQRQLMNCILHGRIRVSEALNATVISLQEAPEAYKKFNAGAQVKYVIDPHRQLQA